MKDHSVPAALESLGDVEQRHRLLQEQPTALGAAWALDWCKDVIKSGRRVEGGWPGTVSEARGRVLRELTRVLAERGLPPLSVNELVEATATAYERAKRDWRLAVGH